MRRVPSPSPLWSLDGHPVSQLPPPQSTFRPLGGQRTQQDSAEPISLIQPHPCVDSLKPHLVVRTQQAGAKPNLHTEWLPLPKNAGHEPWKWVWRKVLRNNLRHCDSTSGAVSGHWKFVWRVKSAPLLGPTWFLSVMPRRSWSTNPPRRDEITHSIWTGCILCVVEKLRNWNYGELFSPSAASPEPDSRVYQCDGPLTSQIPFNLTFCGCCRGSFQICSVLWLYPLFSISQLHWSLVDKILHTWSLSKSITV